jgi:hypothetical protein
VKVVVEVVVLADNVGIYFCAGAAFGHASAGMSRASATGENGRANEWIAAVCEWIERHTTLRSSSRPTAPVR